MSFPSANDFGSAFGINEEDRQKWEKRHEADAKARAGRGIRGALDTTAAQAISMGKMIVNAKLLGRETRDANIEVAEMPRVTEKRTENETTYEKVDVITPEEQARRQRAEEFVKRSESMNRQAEDDGLDR